MERMHIYFPFFPSRHKGDIFKFKAKFSSSAWYPELKEGHEGDWNKLPFHGKFHPYADGVAFVWRYVNKDVAEMFGEVTEDMVINGRVMQLGWYCHDNWSTPAVDKLKGWAANVNGLEETPWMKIDKRDGVKYYFDGELVKELDNEIKGHWLFVPWFGGQARAYYAHKITITIDEE